MITIVRLSFLVFAVGIFLPSLMATEDGSGDGNGGDTASTSEPPAPEEETNGTTEEWTEVAIKPQRKEIF